VNETLVGFWKRWDLQMALPCATPRGLTYRSSESAEQFFLRAVTRNKQNKKRKEKKLTESLYVDPL
jgi:hypothetical protein